MLLPYKPPFMEQPQIIIMWLILVVCPEVIFLRTVFGVTPSLLELALKLLWVLILCWKKLIKRILEVR